MYIAVPLSGTCEKFVKAAAVNIENKAPPTVIRGEMGGFAMVGQEPKSTEIFSEIALWFYVWEPNSLSYVARLRPEGIQRHVWNHLHGFRGPPKVPIDYLEPMHSIWINRFHDSLVSVVEQ